MEKFTIPTGFKNFPLEKLDGNLCCEEAEEKELVLICAPIDFDISTLNEEQIIENGSKLLDSRNRNDDDNNNEHVRKWEVHSSSMCRDMHLNALLPSNLHGKHVLADKFSLSLNIMPRLQIPAFTSPRKQGVGAPLPRPCGLRTRWNAFGAADPLGKRTQKRPPRDLVDDNAEFTVLQGQKQKRKSKSPRERLNSKNTNFDECKEPIVDNAPSIHNNCEGEGDGEKKKKKKRKKKRGMDEVEVEPVNEERVVDVTITSGSNKDHECANAETKSKKRKKEKKMNGGGSLDVTNTASTKIEENDQLKTKKKKKKKKEKSVDVEHEEHTTDVSNFGTASINNQCGNKEVKIKKKNKKNKLETCAYDETEVGNVECPNTNTGSKDKENEVTSKKKKKKKKQKILELAAVKLEDDECTRESTNTFLTIDDHLANIEVNIKKKKKKKKTQEVIEPGIIKKEEETSLDISNTNISNISNTIDNHYTNDEKTKSKKKKKKKSKTVQLGTVKKEDELITSSSGNRESDTSSDKFISSNGNVAKTKKRKRKSDKPLKNKNYIKEEETGDTSEYLNNGFAESVKKEAVDVDSDLDSDTEARILGATPRKRMCSR